ILDMADRAGLDYLCFNDHNTLELADRGWHGKRHGGVLSLVGAELQHRDRKSHLLVFGAESLPPRGHILSQLESLKARGALAVVAHPRETRPLIPFLGGYPWGFGEHPLLDGVEVWNWMSYWKGGVTPLTLHRRITRPDLYVRHCCPGAVELWFRVGGCAVGGADAHGHRILFKGVFPYDFLFARVRTHLLLDSPLVRPEQMEDALRRRRCFISNAVVGDARGFRARVASDTLLVELPGEGWISVFAKAAPPVHTRLLGPGLHRLRVPPGPLHLEVYRRGVTWITCSLAEGGVV
ncbi:MAG TPA: hypothetical protein PK535_11020, partial [Synergistaceae bacterium]|nr:hypothetical protein [Synergistaceae bacterium]